jgi:hypothetical protein
MNKLLFVIVLLTLICAPAMAQSSKPELLLFGGKNNKTFLGCITCNRLSDISIWNKFGDYGSRFSDTSIWNKFGDYGSRYSDYTLEQIHSRCTCYC